MKPKFKKRYVIGVGKPYRECCGVAIGKDKKLNWPVELDDKHCPKYRLVLERVK